jgi:UDP-2-acetamido-3-amino-2,3-dideoxy-glucuronate N-acetyltransferase
VQYNKEVCVVGAGHWGNNHIRTLHKLGALGGVVESNYERRIKVKNDYPEIPVYETITDSINKEKYKGYVIATPAKTHFKLAKKVIIHKKHVLVEKPLTLNIKDAEFLHKLAKINNINLMVGHLLLFHPAIIKIKELLNAGKIGNLQYMYSNRLNLGKIREEENVFWSFAPHDISIFQYINGYYPSKISAHGSTIIQKKIQDSTITLFNFPNKVDAHIFVSWLHPFKEHRLVIIGSEGMLSYEDSMIGKPLKYYNKKFNIKDKSFEKIDGPIEELKYENKMPLEEELKYFLKHLNGIKLKRANSLHGVEVVKILENASKIINL